MKIIVIYLIIFTGTSWTAKIIREDPPELDILKQVTDSCVQNESNIECQYVSRILNATSVPLNITNGLPSMIPDRPINLMMENILSNSATILWERPSLYQFNEIPLTYSISYTSQYSNGQWTQLRHINGQNKNTIKNEFQLNNLEYAYASYIIRIRTKLQDAADIPELWSNYTYYNFTTEARIPDDPPASYVGGFYTCRDNKQMCIIWKNLPASKFNGPNPIYKVYEKNGTETILIKRTTDLIMAYVPKVTNEFEDSEFQVYASNDVGDSKMASVIRVPSQSSQYPQNIKRISKDLNATHSHYYLSWNESHDKDIIGYTICWYRLGIIPNYEVEFDFKQVDKGVHKWDKILYYQGSIVNIGVASNTLTTTSGIEYVLDNYMDPANRLN